MTGSRGGGRELQMPSEMEKNTAAEEKYGERVGRDAVEDKQQVHYYLHKQ